MTRQAIYDRVRNAKESGKLIPQPCEVCGEERTDAHHDDYSQPLIVRWLCRAHHIAHHAKLRREAGVKHKSAILDEFTDLPVSGVRKFRLRMKARGGCQACGKPRVSKSLCRKHLIKLRVASRVRRAKRCSLVNSRLRHQEAA